MFLIFIKDPSIEMSLIDEHFVFHLQTTKSKVESNSLISLLIFWKSVAEFDLELKNAAKKPF